MNLRPISIASFLFAGIVGTSCQATPPTAPSPSVVAIKILYSGFVRLEFGSFEVRAFSVDSDGAYADVTTSTLWSTSNPAVLGMSPGSFGSGKSVSSIAPGSARILASFRNLAAELDVVVPVTPTGPRDLLSLSTRGGGQLRGIGATFQLDATFTRLMGLSSDVTSIATWTSSDQSIATVDRGLITSRNIGTTEIAAVYQGASARILVSVLPGQGGR